MPRSVKLSAYDICIFHLIFHINWRWSDDPTHMYNSCDHLMRRIPGVLRVWAIVHPRYSIGSANIRSLTLHTSPMTLLWHTHLVFWGSGLCVHNVRSNILTHKVKHITSNTVFHYVITSICADLSTYLVVPTLGTPLSCVNLICMCLLCDTLRIVF